MARYTTEYDQDFQRSHALFLDHTPYPWQVLKAQGIAESGLCPHAVSPVGAKGLMQFMPATFDELCRNQLRGMCLSEHAIFVPRISIEAAACYMEHLYKKFGEIPDELERYKFALAAYNAGRGNINEALALARDDEGLPASYKAWAKAGCPAGEWQRWENAKLYLSQVTGSHSVETVNYVDRILRIFGELIREGGTA